MTDPCRTSPCGRSAKARLRKRRRTGDIGIDAGHAAGSVLRDTAASTSGGASHRCSSKRPRIGSGTPDVAKRRRCGSAYCAWWPSFDAERRCRSATRAAAIMTDVSPSRLTFRFHTPGPGSRLAKVGTLWLTTARATWQPYDNQADQHAASRKGDCRFASYSSSLSAHCAASRDHAAPWAVPSTRPARLPPAGAVARR